MAEMIAEMPIKLRGSFEGERKYSIENIKEWCDGHARKFKRGEDFNCKPAGFGSYMNRQAKALGLQATSRVRGDYLYFQVIGPLKQKNRS